MTAELADTLIAGLLVVYFAVYSAATVKLYRRRK